LKDIKEKCLACGGRLYIKRTWTKVYFCCRSCAKNYPEDRYKDLMDEYLEEKLANIPVNRLW